MSEPSTRLFLWTMNVWTWPLDYSTNSYNNRFLRLLAFLMCFPWVLGFGFIAIFIVCVLCLLLIIWEILFWD